MLKLPSPSVVWAQNSPVILTMGFTRVRSIGMAAKRSRTSRRAAMMLVAEELVEELAEVFRGAGEARLLQEFARSCRASSQGWRRRMTSCSISMDSSRTRSVSPAFTS